MSELLSYINLEEYVICNKAICECFRYLDTKLAEKNNNFAIQAIVAAPDKKQIEKIKRELKGIIARESKLKTWDYIEGMEMHECLERSNEIINNLGLVPDSFI